MSVLRYGSKLFNGTESKAYVYFNVDGLVNADINGKLTEKEYIGIVQRLASDAIKRGLLTIEDIIEKE